jgi:hypothetical protein
MVREVQDHQHRLDPAPVTFPTAGFRARRWQRFERDLALWLATPDGQFARWRAEQAVAER